MENTKIIIACLPKVSCMAGNEKDELNSMLDSAPYRSTSITKNNLDFFISISGLFPFYRKSSHPSNLSLESMTIHRY